MNKVAFKNYYEQAQTTDVKTNDFFNCAGYFWIHLTQPQLNKMIDLMVEQGCVADEEGWVSLVNGMKFRKIMQIELPTPKQVKREIITSTLKDILGSQYSK